MEFQKFQRLINSTLISKEFCRLFLVQKEMLERGVFQLQLRKLKKFSKIVILSQKLHFNPKINKFSLFGSKWYLAISRVRI